MIATLLLLLLGFAALNSAMPRHQARWLRARRSRRPVATLRYAGFLAIALAIIPAVRAHGWAVGLAAWGGWMSLAAGVVLTISLLRENGLSRRD